MRQIFSIRFVAAVGAVVGLFVLLWVVFATREALIDNGGAGGPVPHRIDLVEVVFAVSDQQVRFVDGAVDRTVTLAIDGTRAVNVTKGTAGVNFCPAMAEIGGCAVVADLLGEGVVWFALVPRATGNTVRLPAIESLDDGWATLTNGWQVPYAPILDRRCADEEFDSFGQFQATLGDDFVSIFDTVERRLVAVECHQAVAW